jgi:hypothetical protein
MEFYRLIRAPTPFKRHPTSPLTDSLRSASADRAQTARSFSWRYHAACGRLIATWVDNWILEFALHLLRIGLGFHPDSPKVRRSTRGRISLHCLVKARTGDNVIRSQKKMKRGVDRLSTVLLNWGGAFVFNKTSMPGGGLAEGTSAEGCK